MFEKRALESHAISVDDAALVSHSTVWIFCVGPVIQTHLPKRVSFFVTAEGLSDKNSHEAIGHYTLTFASLFILLNR